MKDPRTQGQPGADRPAHPMLASVVLVTGVVLLIVALAVASTLR